VVHEMNVKTRFGETDALGHLNNTSYFIYFEEARIQFFDEIGANTSPNQWQFILASTKCDFVSQGYFKQLLSIKTTVSRVGTKSFTLYHEVIDKDTGELIARGEAIIVYFNFEKQRSEKIPEDMKALLMGYSTVLND
jgi:acyl-CoA thioester hydrolase